MTWGALDRELDTPAHHDPGIAVLERDRLNTDPSAWVDENLELYESNQAAASRSKLAGQERWEGKENEESRLINILSPSGVIRRLRRAGIDAREEAHPNARIWLNDWTREGLVGVNAWVRPQEMDDEGYLVMLSTVHTQWQKDYITANFHACRAGRKVQKTITSLQEPYGPEWSLMRFDLHGVARKEKYRGWRTAMMVLIVAEILTEEEVDRAFGPAIGPASAWYREQLQVYRQIRVGKAI